MSMAPTGGGSPAAPVAVDGSAIPADVGSGSMAPASQGSTATRLPPPTVARAYSCQCGRPIFFRNSTCLACGTPLGYDPERGLMLPLEPVGKTGFWREFGGGRRLPRRPRLRRCANLQSAAGCNWLIAETDTAAGPGLLCRCCRLTRTLPDLSVEENARWWMRIELAKRRLVSSLIGLKLPVLALSGEDAAHGLAFDLLRSLPGAPPVVTGHADGVITIDLEEADDSTREQRRERLLEPYRTLLGHLRHECGHYYWQRLIDGSPWHDAYRVVFGDERQDYAAALQRHYTQGPPADWGKRFVSAYASSHPWEDWAETWAHYLHLRDTLDTAASFGLDGERVELHYERFGPDVLAESLADGASTDGRDDFLTVLNGWMELTGVLNELSRSMGVPDFYPYVLSPPAVRKLHFVHRVVLGIIPAPRAVVPAAAPPPFVPDGPVADPVAGGVMQSHP